MSAIGYGANVNNQNPAPYQKTEKCTLWKKIALLINVL